MSGVIRGFFFDMDGTLADTHEAGTLAYHRALADEGHHVDPAAVRAAIAAGRGSTDFLRELAPGIEEDQLRRIQHKKHDHYSTLLGSVKFNAELIHFLRAMQIGHKIVLVTHAKRKNVDLVLAAGGLEDAFDHIVAYEDTATHKPDPSGYLHALAAASLEPEEVIAFEDSQSGIDAARAAGISVVKIEMSYAH